MNSTTRSTLILYKQLLRECYKFSLYNYREYFLRRVREEFHQNRNIQDSSKIAELLKRGQENLEMLRRQATIGNMYTPTRHEIRKNKQEIRQAQREIARQKIQLEKQKIEHENQLKAAASRGDQKVLRQSTKNIIHTHNQINRLGKMDAQLSTLQSTMINMTSQQSMAPALVNMSRMMSRTNRMMPINGMARVGQNFEKSMTIASIKQEMMDEIMNSAFEDENDEEETDNMVEAILNEMHITVANKMSNAQGHATITSGRKIKVLTTTDADLEARLNALRHR